jgi:hypothetical protein
LGTSHVGRRAITAEEARRCLKARRSEGLKYEANVQQLVGRSGEGSLRRAQDALEQTYRDANGDGQGRTKRVAVVQSASNGV